MNEARLKTGDRAPDFTLMASHHQDVMEVTLQSLLTDRRGLVLTSYVLDFTGG